MFLGDLTIEDFGGECQREEAYILKARFLTEVVYIPGKSARRAFMCY
jgi:hypothetical protein